MLLQCAMLIVGLCRCYKSDIWLSAASVILTRRWRATDRTWHIEDVLFLLTLVGNRQGENDVLVSGSWVGPGNVLLSSACVTGDCLCVLVRHVLVGRESVHWPVTADCVPLRDPCDGYSHAPNIEQVSTQSNTLALAVH